MSEMGRLEFTSPKEAWGGEATDFTPLLGQDHMLEYLGETTGIGRLAPVEIEHATAGSRSLDILAETEDGRRVPSRTSTASETTITSHGDSPMR